MSANKLTYEEKLNFANMFLKSNYGISWDDLPDIEDLNECKTKKEVEELCSSLIREIAPDYPLTEE